MANLRKDFLSKINQQRVDFTHLTSSKNLTPLNWTDFFTIREDFELKNGTLSVYVSDISEGSEGLSLLLLHGAGLTSLSWCCFVSEIKKIMNCRCIAVDLRNHGLSTAFDDLSFESLVGDVKEIFDHYLKNEDKVVVVGHSLGGSVAVGISHQFPEKVVGLVVLDAVEGLIKQFINEINRVILSRPLKFNSLEEAILWRLNSGICKNETSNRVSMPSQLISLKDHSGGVIYKWKIDLSQTKKYWKSWFDGMSNGFVKARAKKLLILTTADNLDGTLMVGQMQGKFQLITLNNCGHLMHEDLPDEVAQAVVKFVRWHKIA